MRVWEVGSKLGFHMLLCFFVWMFRQMENVMCCTKVLENTAAGHRPQLDTEIAARGIKSHSFFLHQTMVSTNLEVGSSQLFSLKVGLPLMARSARPG